MLSIRATVYAAIVESVKSTEFAALETTNNTTARSTFETAFFATESQKHHSWQKPLRSTPHYHQSAYSDVSENDESHSEKLF